MAGATYSAIAYGGVPAAGGAPGSRLVATGSTPVVAGYEGYCAAIKDDGTHCSARPAKDTYYCIGHLRSMGEA